MRWIGRVFLIILLSPFMLALAFLIVIALVIALVVALFVAIRESR